MEINKNNKFLQIIHTFDLHSILVDSQLIRFLGTSNRIFIFFSCNKICFFLYGILNIILGFLGFFQKIINNIEIISYSDGIFIKFYRHNLYLPYWKEI